MIAGSAEPFLRRRAENRVQTARKNVKPQECQLGGSKTFLHGLYYTLFFLSSEEVDCAVLREMSVTAREVLSHQALNGVI